MRIVWRGRGDKGGSGRRNELKYVIIKKVREQQFGADSEDVLLIVVSVSGNWGLLVFVFHEERIGSFSWGDSLNCPPPKGLLGTIF